MKCHLLPDDDGLLFDEIEFDPAKNDGKLAVRYDAARAFTGLWGLLLRKHTSSLGYRLVPAGTFDAQDKASALTREAHVVQE